MIKRSLTIKTDASGDATAYADVVPGGATLYAVQLIDGNLADGVDVTITAEESNMSFALLTKADFNDDQVLYPRVAASKVVDGSALTEFVEPLAVGRIKVVIAQGGDKKTGGVALYFRSL
ncbi:MAG TPA: hypothetical protein PKC99_12710 [Anaerolineales bacterium]|nr:hypothetical protein [Anaerolineales bacterium]